MPTPQQVSDAFNACLDNGADPDANEDDTQVLQKNLPNNATARITARRVQPQNLNPRLEICISINRGPQHPPLTQKFWLRPHAPNQNRLQVQILTSRDVQNDFNTTYPLFSITEATWSAGKGNFGRPYFCAKFFSLDGVDDSFRPYWPQNVANADWEASIPQPEDVDEVQADQIGDQNQNWNPVNVFEFFVAVGATLLLRCLAKLAEENGIENNDNWHNFLEYFKESKLTPRRPVNLEPAQVMAMLHQSHTHLPWGVIEKACSSLNAGKNIILSGPPGCGKTTLAKALASHAANTNPLIVTASPNWTTDELIGRYMPAIENSGQLRFAPGFFLQAVEANKWLVIDELNRADIDSCFGELFTVLSGQPVVLPFQERVGDTDSENNDDRDLGNVAIFPPGTKSDGYDGMAHYSIAPSFRMIATMNNSDISQLHRLSYAFQRRFAIINVEPPNNEDLSKLINEFVDHAIQPLGENDQAVARYVYHNLRTPLARWNALCENLTECMEEIFSGDEGLVTNEVVGVSQIHDTVRFALECLSTNELGQGIVWNGPGNFTMPRGIALLKSYIAQGLALSVFPQLVSLIDSGDIYSEDAPGRRKLESSLRVILQKFNGNDFYYIKGAIENDAQIYTLIHSTNTINDYLKSEFKQTFRGALDDMSLDDIWRTAEAQG